MAVFLTVVLSSNYAMLSNFRPNISSQLKGKLDVRSNESLC